MVLPLIDGTSNIVIETCFYNGTYSENASVRHTVLSDRKVIGSEGSFDPCSNTTTPYRYYERPNIRLTMETSAGLEDINISSEVMVYPNPTKRTITIKNNNLSKINEVNLVNIKGQTNLIITNPDKDNLTITLPQNITKGIYILVLTSDEEIIKKKIIIE